MFNNHQAQKKSNKEGTPSDPLEKSRQLGDAWLNSDIQKRIEMERKKEEKEKEGNGEESQ